MCVRSLHLLKMSLLLFVQVSAPPRTQLVSGLRLPAQLSFEQLVFATDGLEVLLQGFVVALVRIFKRFRDDLLLPLDATA